MLKNRSSTVTSKQGWMRDRPSTAASPTSILETMPFSSLRNGSRKGCKDYEEGTRAIGRGLLDVLTNEDSVKSVSIQEKRVVVFGSQLKIQIPSTTESDGVSTGRSTAEPRHSPIEFGIKTRNSLVALYPSPPARRSWIPPSEMALSEDYTRVVLHGPNPKTTHIFDDCIIEGGGNELVDTEDGRNCSCGDQFGYPVDDYSTREDIFIKRFVISSISREKRQ
ncbi:FCS-Like Zinc finger 8-like isoform X2 [Zingiber officinale]|nr:FCS-Like Zinc finger 8-like isoform X2 [Zingiber officinale]XP_042427001.1 FCS-Like Zinc finger 8-like isoform X2 [Zingiber officinale]